MTVIDRCRPFLAVFLTVLDRLWAVFARNDFLRTQKRHLGGSELILQLRYEVLIHTPPDEKPRTVTDRQSGTFARRQTLSESVWRRPQSDTWLSQSVRFRTCEMRSVRFRTCEICEMRSSDFALAKCTVQIVPAPDAVVTKRLCSGPTLD